MRRLIKPHPLDRGKKNPLIENGKGKITYRPISTFTVVSGKYFFHLTSSWKEHLPEKVQTIKVKWSLVWFDNK